MEIPYRKSSRNDDERDEELEETNDVRSSLQGPLREGGPRAEDAGFLGGAAPLPASAPLVSHAPRVIFLILAAVYAAC